MITDVHNHVVPELVVELLNSDPIYGIRIKRGIWYGNNHQDFAFEPSFYEPAAKLAQLEAKGIEGVIVSPVPMLFVTELEMEPAEALARAVNQGLVEWQDAYPERIRWLGQVPIRYPELAAVLLEEMVVVGAAGVEITTRVEERRLDNPEFEVFWAAAERLRIPVLLHPHKNEPHGALGDYYLQNVIGNMLETTVAIERLLCAGVLDRHPDLKLVLVHAGGYFPWQAGRLRHARAVRPELASAPEDPWRYRGQIVVDTITHDVEALRYLISRMGSENVVLGTDLPFDMFNS